MYKMRFEDFVERKYDKKIDAETSLYLVRDGNNDVLYIGYSDNIIWERWFASGIVAHIQPNIYGQLYGQSPIGELLLKSRPQSSDWIIELWTRDEGLNQFLPNVKNRDAVPTHWIEAEMIAAFSPKLNINNNIRRKEL